MSFILVKHFTLSALSSRLFTYIIFSYKIHLICIGKQEGSSLILIDANLFS